MNHIIRRYQQPLLIALTVFIIISFVLFFNGGRFMEKGSGETAGQMYGRSVTQLQLIRANHDYELSRVLQMNDLVKALCDLPIPEEMLGMYRELPEKYTTDFRWNLLILRHEAERLGLTATPAERDEAVKQMPAFQNQESGGAFDSGRFNMFVANFLSPRGMSTDGFEELVADQIKLRKVLALLGATTAPAPAEVRAAYDEHYRKTEASVVRLKLDDFLATATAPEEEVKKMFEERTAKLKSDELRKVKVAAFILPPADKDKPLEPKARAEALGKLGKAAEDFSVAVTEKDAKFDEAAAKAGVTIEETPEFSRNSPAPSLAVAPAVAAAAFKLTTKDPTSDVLTTDRGYYVLQLTGITPARPLTFDEAKPQLVEQLKRDRAQEAMTIKGNELRAKIAAELKAGKTFAEAATAAGATAETVPAFSPAEPNTTLPDAREVMQVAGDLKDGDLSPFTPTEAGSVLVHLDKHVPADDTKFAADQATIADSMAGSNRAMLFSEWLKLRRAEAHIMEPRRG